MFWTITFLMLTIGSLVLGNNLSEKYGKKNEEGELEKNSLIKYSGFIFGTLFFAIMIMTNFLLMTPKNEYAQFNKRIFGNQLTDGRIIAINGEMGPQGWIKREGLSLIPFVNFIYSVEFKNIIEVPEGKLLTLSAKDGIPMGKNEFYAPNWYDNASKEDKKQYTRAEYNTQMLNADFFLLHGGKKGPQVNVLSPGKYAINTNLWTVQMADAIKIDTGEVGVVTSKVGDLYEQINRGNNEGNVTISVPLVPRGYIGVWKDTLTAGSYYMNPNAYKVEPVDMRAQVWLYKGGYIPREVEIAVTKRGDIGYRNVPHNMLKVPKNAADSAIAVKTKDKYTVYIELRLQIQPDSNHASSIVAGIGSLQMVEDKVITPAVRSVLRNIGMKYDAIEFVDKRVEIENACKAQITKKAIQAGVPAKEVFFGNIDIPPAVLTPQKVEELSKKMKKAYEQQNDTYKQLIITNETKATADQQSILVEAKINKERSKFQADAREIKGIGERKYMVNVAKGQEAQKKVLGAEKTYALQMWKESISLLKLHPQIGTAMPLVFSSKNGAGGGSDISEAASILALQQLKKAQDNITRSPNKKKK